VALCVAFGAAPALAATCEQNFGTRGDPRNGAEFFTAADAPGVSVASALGQFRVIAAADGFRVHSEEIAGGKGTLTIEQVRGRPFLIQLGAEDKGGGRTEVSVQTRLNKGATARPEDIRGSMCGMIARLKAGRAGEQAAAASRAQTAASAGVTEVKAITLAREIDSLARRTAADLLSARFKGRAYRLDGQIKEPLDDGRTVELWYDTFNEGNWFMPPEAGSEMSRAQIICVMAPDQAAEARRLRSGEYARLSGKVAFYRRSGDLHRLQFEGCRFSH